MPKTDQTRVVEYSSPDDMLEQLDDFDRIAPLIVQLTRCQQMILNALAVNMLSNDHVTDTKIAETLGIARHTINNARKNPIFGQCLAIITRDIVRGQTDRTLSNIKKHESADWRASEFLLKYTGEYVPKSQSQNLNVNLSASQAMQAKTPTDLLDTICIQLIEMGISADRVKDRMIELQREGI